MDVYNNIVGNFIDDFNLEKKHRAILASESKEFEYSVFNFQVERRPLVAKIRQTLYLGMINGYLHNYNALSKLYQDNPESAEDLMHYLMTDHSLFEYSNYYLVFPLVETYLIDNYNSKSMEEKKDQHKILKEEITKHIEVCDSNRTPVICRMRSSPQALKKLIDSIIQLVVKGNGMSISQAINTLEYQYNDNRIDD